MEAILDSKTLDLIDAIADLPEDWHGAGTVDKAVLLAIARIAQEVGTIYHSVETGSGKTTLLLSHLSHSHSVFAVDAGNSITQVKQSPLFNASRVTFIEGPTQQTLPKHKFTQMHQLALIDGPHGYPFPDIEYYYLYPTIPAGGLLIIDDTRIPSIGRMCEIIREDDMFALVEVVNDNTAFFRRTDASLIDPLSDSWWLQGFNRSYYEELFKAHPPSKSSQAPLSWFLGVLGRAISKRLRREPSGGVK